MPGQKQSAGRQAPPRRKVGQPVEPALRRKIIAELRKGSGVAAAAKATGVEWKTADRVRVEAGLTPRPSGRNNSAVATPEITAKILARLTAEDKPSDEDIAAELEIGRAVVRRVRLKAKIPPRPRAAAHKLGASPADRRIIQLEDEVRRLTAELKAAHRSDLDSDAIREILGGIAAAPVDPPDWLVKASPKATGATGATGPTPEVPVTIWSDWHVGEQVSRAETSGVNAFDPAIAEARIRRLVEATVKLAKNYHVNAYPGVVVNLLGDFVSGGIHPELVRTDVEEVIPSTLRVRDILIWAIERMAEAFGRVYAPCASGNHGRQTLKPEAKRYVYKNFDWLIYQLLARHFAGDKRVVIDVRAANEVHYRVFGQRYLALHGDQLGVKGGDGIIGSLGPISRGEVKVGKQQAAIGRDYDVLLMGHWHQPLWLPRVIVAGTLKGWDEYAKNVLRALPAEPSQPLWFVHPRRGITSRWDVKVDAPVSGASADWVSWHGAEAEA